MAETQPAGSRSLSVGGVLRQLLKLFASGLVFVVPPTEPSPGRMTIEKDNNVLTVMNWTGAVTTP